MDDARALLAEAEELEAHEPALALLASNLDWMRGALAALRAAESAGRDSTSSVERASQRLPAERVERTSGARPARTTVPSIVRLVALKYAACAAGALLASACALVLAAPLAPWIALALAPLGFYVVEAQLVFLVPLAIDGEPRPWSTSIARTRRAGGTLRVLRTVLPIAAFMLAGAFVRRGAARSWRIGCLAVLLWYERVRYERHEPALRERRASS